MASLAEFANICAKIKSTKRSNISAFHKFLFHEEGDRNSRRRIREFEGFDFSKDDEEYNHKFMYVQQNISQAGLISICLILDLQYDKHDLIGYIFSNLRKGELLKHKDDEHDEDDDEEDEDDEDERETNNEDQQSMVVGEYLDRQRPNTRRVQQRFSLSFRDVEETIKPFDGKNNTITKEWVREFEETAELYGWDEIQMLVFSKKSLTGLAKQFVNGEKGLTTWTKLKNALLIEFRERTNSRQLHKLLTERTMTKDESVLEYLYIMKEIAAKGSVTEKDLILYIIDGIKDLHINKQLLYGANNLSEFKEKLHDYQDFITTRPIREDKRKTEPTVTDKSKQNSESRATANQNLKCFNCGGQGHRSKDCNHKQKGAKCFKCNNFGHIAKECTRMTESISKEVRSVSVQDKHMMKSVLINKQQCQALIDPGSHVNIINYKTYLQLALPEMSNTKICLTGFGNRVEKFKPMGWVEAVITIDNEQFQLTFYVVPEHFMSEEIIIGLPLYKEAETVINPEGVTIKKWKVNNTAEDEYQVMNISIDAEKDPPYNIEETASREAKTEVRNAVDNYKPEKVKSTNVIMKIILTDETPIACRPRRLPLNERKTVDEQISTWLSEGIIEPSESEFSSPIVLVNKKDGTKRLCVDYRRINKVIVRDRFPLPLIDDQLDRLQDAKIFSTIDLKNGFFHVEIEKDSRKYTSFVTHEGQYQFLKVPFGLSNSPAVFQRFVNAIFRNLTQKGIALPYVDDIIIPAKNEVEAVTNLKQVLELSRDYGLNLNFKKCHFLKKRIEFLGHVIENQKIMPSPKKIEAVINYPLPKNLKQVHSFLGLAGYFRKFIPGFSKEAKALSDLTKQNSKFVMKEEQVKSFETLKLKVCSNLVLKIYNQDHETELHTDASMEGYGAVLLQRAPDDGLLHPIQFMSRKTTDLEQKYTSYELEILAVVEALKKFRVYLLGIKFKLITDCNAFVKTMEKKDLSTRVARWLLLLQEYDYVIEHRSGMQMRHVDALSRCYMVKVTNYAKIMNIKEENLLKRILRAQEGDEHLKPIIEVLKQEESYDGFYQKANILYKWVDGKELLVIPKSLQFEIIRKAHEKGHFATNKTKELLKNDYYIPRLEDKIRQVITSCLECVLLNKKRGQKEGLLHPIPKPDVPLHTYHVDHIGPLESTSKMYKYIFVIIDAFSKFCWLYPTKSTTSKEVINKLEQQAVIFGNPEVIISDRGTAFTSEEFQFYCQSEKIKHHTITTEG